jgi:hypothetical protein
MEKIPQLSDHSNESPFFIPLIIVNCRENLECGEGIGFGMLWLAPIPIIYEGILLFFTHTLKDLG